MVGKVKYLVFAAGMLVLVIGVSISVWTLLDRSSPTVEAPVAGGSASLAQALAQAMDITEEEGAELAARLQAAVQQADATATTDEGISLSQALVQTLGLSDEEAREMAERLRVAAEQAGLTASESGGPAGGTGDVAQIGDSLDFEVRDASGNLKQSGSDR